jgi:hypothetical protein
MKRLALAASLAFALVAAGCDDDPATPPADAGGDAAKLDSSVGGDSGGPAGMCTGTFAALTRTSLKALSGSGKCTSDTDLDFICTGDISTKARECGVTCKTLGAPNLPDCVSQCLMPKTKISSGCTECYRDLVICTAVNCQECVADPNSAACMMCQLTSGCFTKFFGCSGLPSGAPRPDAAVDAPVVDAAMDTAPKVDAPVDAGSDAGPDASPDAGTDTSSSDAGVADASDGATD